MKTTKYVVLVIAILTGFSVIAFIGVQENNKVSIEIPSNGEIETPTPTPTPIATPILNATVTPTPTPTPTLTPLPTGSIPLPTTPPNPHSIDDYYFNR